MAQDYNELVTGVTRVNSLYNIVNTNMEAIKSQFSGSSAPSNPSVGQPFYNTVSGHISFWNGSSWDNLEDASANMSFAVSDVLASSGTKASLEDRLAVAINPNGTLKDPAPVGPSVVMGYSDYLFDETNKLISGKTQGTEGRWKCVFVGSVTPTEVTIRTLVGSPGTKLLDENTQVLKDYGDFWLINPDHKHFTIGDSGVPYQGHFANSDYSSIRAIQLHPKHGDVTADFTVGNTYPVYVFQESSDPADQQTGDLDVIEYFLGNNKTDTASVNAITGGVGSYATLNAGYWDGKTWVSQLGDGSETVFKLGRKAQASPSLVERYNGTWSTETGWTFSTITNALTLSTALAATEGLRVTYTTKARRVRPIVSPSRVKSVGDVFYLADAREQNGPALFCEVTGTVPAVTPGAYQLSVLKTWMEQPNFYFVKSEFGGGIWHETHVFWSRSNALKMATCTYERGGTLWVGLLVKELVYDSGAGSWGDDGKIPVVDNVVTTTDDNGNVVLCGTYGYDTGIPA